MYSRYSLMTESTVVDEETKESYPDPLSVNFSKMKLTEVPQLVPVNQSDLNRFWLFIYKYYKVSEGDDIILNLNNIPYLGMVSPGDQIYLPSNIDLYSPSFEV